MFFVVIKHYIIFRVHFPFYLSPINCITTIYEQEKHDIALDKLSVKEYADPFKGGERGKGNRLEQK